MTHTHAKGGGQRSLGPKVRVETDGQTNGRTEANCITSRANAVANYTSAKSIIVQTEISTVD